MKYLELSKENLENETKALFEMVKKEFTPDAVLFIAKGGFYLGVYAGKYFSVPIYEAVADRSAGGLKEKLSALLQILPKKIKIVLRTLEISSGIHKKISNRNITIKNKDVFTHKRILFIDDSVDTGSTLISVIKQFKDKNIQVKTAALNVMSDSLNNIKTDYFLYKNTMICGPWSVDSIENPGFLKDYFEWKNLNG